MQYGTVDARHPPIATAVAPSVDSEAATATADASAEPKPKARGSSFSFSILSIYSVGRRGCFNREIQGLVIPALRYGFGASMTPGTGEERPNVRAWLIQEKLIYDIQVL